jgi:hypothetical protein
MRENGFSMTPEEQSKLAKDFQDVLRTLTRAGVILWRRSEAIHSSDFKTELVTGIKTPPSGVPTFLATLQIEVGMLEDILEFPSLETGSSGRTEIGPKLQLLSDGDGDGEVQEETSLALQPDLLATIENSVRECEDFLGRIGKIGRIQ